MANELVILPRDRTSMEEDEYNQLVFMPVGADAECRANERTAIRLDIWRLASKYSHPDVRKFRDDLLAELNNRGGYETQATKRRRGKRIIRMTGKESGE